MNNLDSNDEDSEEFEFASVAGEDANDVHVNHYRVPKLVNYGLANGTHASNSSGISRIRANLKQVKFSNEGKIVSLFEMAVQKIACHYPFGMVEHRHELVPEDIQCRIAFWSFPQDEEDIKLYTCLANGNADFFYRAEELLKVQDAVRDMLQVGYHLSANVIYMNSETEQIETYRVALTFDRRRITTCSCTCMAGITWCQHVVAVCLQRIRRPLDTKLRAPVSESLQRLERNQLQKFALYLIEAFPQQILPEAQNLLDDILSGEKTEINTTQGAPDPTSGALLHEKTRWCLDYTHLSNDIHRILIKQCTAQPTVCSDIQSLHETAPPATTEFSQLLRPVRGREPEGIWNLISIIGEMMKRRDPNSFSLLEIMTEEIMKVEKIITWWFETKVSLHSGSTIHFASSKNSQSTSQYSCSNFCDEIVHLWRLAALNPSSNSKERQFLHDKCFLWHKKILEKHLLLCEKNGSPNISALNNLICSKTSKRNYLELFPGFKSAMEGCQIDWSDWDEKRGELVTVVSYIEHDNPIKTSKKRKRKKSKHGSAAADVNPNAAPQTSQTNAESTVDQSLSDMMHPLTVHDEAEKGNIENHDDVVESNQAHSKDASIDDRSNQKEDAGCNGNVEASGSIEEIDDRNSPHGQVSLQNSHRASPPPRVGEVELQGIGQPQDYANNHELDQLERDLDMYRMEEQPEDQQEQNKPETLEDLIKVNQRRLADPLETMYAKVEGLHAHGYLEEARRVARRLSHEILSQKNYPSMKQLFILPRRRKKKGSLDNQMSIVASNTLSKIHFLCNLLQDESENNSLIFKLVLFGVEMKRSPAATKPLEVKLISQKQELISFLKNINLNESDYENLRLKAESIRDATNENQDPLASLILGSYIFEHFTRRSDNSNKNPATEVNLGFQTALGALGVKLNVSENDHPLLCEGIRRGRGELALSLILKYKDDQEKLDAILKQLLDKDLIETNGRNPATAAISHQVASTTLSNAEVNDVAQASTSSRSPVLSSNNMNVSDTSGPMPAGVSSATNRKSTSTNQQQQLQQDYNQPTEAAAHFMFELAKTVFDKAGGNSTTAHLFRPQLGSRGIHRKLHMCSLRIALYALGLQNRTSPNWLQRTYNGRASFIHDQALELGLPAIKYLSENWDGYLTPVEAASVADKAGCNNDPETKRIAAEMAKSCLKYVNHLDSNAVSRILVQCKEQTIEMIEEACTEIEQIAENDNVCPDVLFVTARAWFNLYVEVNTNNDRNHCSNGNLYQLNNLVSPGQLSAMQQQQAPQVQDYDQQAAVAQWLAHRNMGDSYRASGGAGVTNQAPLPPHAPNQIQHMHVMAPVAAGMAASVPDMQLPSLTSHHHNHHHHHPHLIPSMVIPIDPTKMPYSQPDQQQQNSPKWDMVYPRPDIIMTPEIPSDANIDYVRAAFRVGIKAMDSMKLPNHLGSKYNPKKQDEILWLLAISKSLGYACLYEFKNSIIKNITDPYILHIIIVDIITFFRSIGLPEVHIDRTKLLRPILVKCLDRCMKQVKDLLKHTSYDQRNFIENIFDVVQKLTEVTREETAAYYYLDILKFVEHKIDKLESTKRNNRRSKIHIDTSLRWAWIKKWAAEHPEKGCFCDKCLLRRYSPRPLMYPSEWPVCCHSDCTLMAHK